MNKHSRIKNPQNKFNFSFSKDIMVREFNNSSFSFIKYINNLNLRHFCLKMFAVFFKKAS